MKRVELPCGRLIHCPRVTTEFKPSLTRITDANVKFGLLATVDSSEESGDYYVETRPREHNQQVSPLSSRAIAINNKNKAQIAERSSFAQGGTRQASWTQLERG